jgi:hypothetical protein
MCKFVGLLADPGKLDLAFTKWNEDRGKAKRPLVDRAVFEHVSAANNSVFVETADKPPTYRWRHDRNGVDVILQEATALGAAQSQQVDATAAAMDLITAFANGLAKLQI